MTPIEPSRSATPRGASPRRRVSGSGVLLSIFSAALMVAAMWLPWWRMECRAPQLGQRVLWIDISPLTVTGDMKELDGLGHYVGMRVIESFAPFERSMAPFGIALVAALLLSLPLLPRRWLRLLPLLAAIAVPVGFAVDLYEWQRFAVTHLDPHAPLNMIANRVDARLLGSYAIAQFKVVASFQAGFWLAVVGTVMALGFGLGELRRDGLIRGRRARSETRSLETRSLAAAAAASVAAVLILFSPTARAATHEVGATAEHRSIGAAVAAANPGDEIVVHAGVYREHVVIDRALTLRGEVGAIVDGDGTGTIGLVEKGPTVVRGFTLRNGGDSLLGEDAGVKLKGAASCAIDGNEVLDTLFGILVMASPKTRVTGNHVLGMNLAISRRGDGIRLHASNDSIVDDNLIDRSRDLAIWQSSRVVARRNVVRHSRYGLHYMFCDDDLFEDNVFEDNQVGAAVMYSRRLTLRRNHFVRSRGPSAYGLLIKVGDDVLVENNWFVDNTRGVFLDDTPSSFYSKCVFRRNLVAGNDAGVSLSPSVSRVAFTENAFIANRVEVEVLGSVPADRNVWSVDGRGNYWSDYVGFDADGDGIGDTPYRVEHFIEHLGERWPAVGLLRFGPAAEALEMAARAFPVVKPATVVTDPHPLVRPPSAIGRPPEGEPRPWLVIGGVAALSCVGWMVRRARTLEDGGVS